MEATESKADILDPKNDGPCLFISHRHADKEVADVFREAIEDWSNGSIKVFQSSNAENAFLIGDELDDSIDHAIADSNVVLLIYTDDAADWSWCMYECGLAQDPASMDTRLVVFHTTKSPPSQLDHLITVPFTKETLRALVDDFHTDAEFFPRHIGAIAPGIDTEHLETRAMELYDDLFKCIPTVKARRVKRYERLILALDLDYVMELNELEDTLGYREAMKRSRQILEEHVFVSRVFGDPHAFFNLEVLPDHLPFQELVDRWKDESEHAELNWHDELYRELANAVLNRKERSLSSMFNTLEPDSGLWLLPAVIQYQTVPHKKVAEFEVLLCSFRPDALAKAAAGF